MREAASSMPEKMPCVCFSEELEANITAQQRSEELLELQETLFWPNLPTLFPESYVPEVCQPATNPLS